MLKSKLAVGSIPIVGIKPTKMAKIGSNWLFGNLCQIWFQFPTKKDKSKVFSKPYG